MPLVLNAINYFSTSGACEILVCPVSPPPQPISAQGAVAYTIFQLTNAPTGPTSSPTTLSPTASNDALEAGVDRLQARIDAQFASIIAAGKINQDTRFPPEGPMFSCVQCKQPFDLQKEHGPKEVYSILVYVNSKGGIERSITKLDKLACDFAGSRRLQDVSTRNKDEVQICAKCFEMKNNATGIYTRPFGGSGTPTGDWIYGGSMQQDTAACPCAHNVYIGSATEFILDPFGGYCGVNRARMVWETCGGFSVIPF